MKKFVTLLFIIICSATLAEAQTFLEHIQKKETGKASVKVSQSKEIDELVNGKVKITATPTGTNANKTEEHKTTTSENKTNANRETAAAVEKNGLKPKEENANKHETAIKPEEKRNKTEETAENQMEIPTIDMRKKVMRQSYKINGYRVQAYAGGNSRADRQRAEGARDKIKQILPNEPVYVHFYSPRWICRVGNYRSYEEAERILKQVRNLGYKQASIVRGKITVQY